MNSNANLLKRLLKLFPVKILKSQFDVDSYKQADIIAEALNKYSEKSIIEFAIENIGFSKQHTFIFDLGKNFKRSSFVKEDLPMQIEKEIKENDNYVFVGFPIVEYNIALLEPYEPITVQFYQPTRVVIHNSKLIIQTTIMERKASHYIEFDKKRPVFEIGRKNTEDDFVPKILELFSREYNVQKCDINKGVKHLWSTDVFDCRSIKFKKDKSTATEAMDEEYTVKCNAPELYEDALKRPLNKTTFKYLGSDDKFSRNFVADPSQGLLSMAIFPESPIQTWNVINEILRHN